MQKGQALVVVMLVLAVVVTVGLAIVSRSSTEVKVSTTQEEASRALEAAETGLEKYLSGVSTGGESGTVNATVDSQYRIGAVTNLGGGNSYQIPFFIAEGDAVTVNMAGYTGNSLRVCWGFDTLTEAEDRHPAMEVVLYYQSGGNVLVKRNGFDPVDGRREGATGNSFLDANGGADNCQTTTAFDYSTLIHFQNAAEGFELAPGDEPLYLRLRPVYGQQTAVQMAVRALGGGTIPSQAGEVESVGQVGVSVQRIKAVVDVWDPPAMFDYAVFSGTSIVQ